MGEVLQTPTLVLNRNWQPVHITTAHRAVVMLWSDTAHVICPDTYRMFTWAEWVELPPAIEGLTIRTSRLRFGVPEVVRLSDYSRAPTRQVVFTRGNVLKRDHNTCQYCNKKHTRDDLTIDHVVPRSHGGANTWTNCVAACVECNARKADRTPEQAGMKLRRVPLQPEWQPFHAGHGLVQRWRPFFDHKPADNRLSVYTG